MKNIITFLFVSSLSATIFAQDISMKSECGDTAGQAWDQLMELKSEREEEFPGCEYRIVSKRVANETSIFSSNSCWKASIHCILECESGF